MCVPNLLLIPLELPKFLKHLVRTIAHTDELPNINIRLVSPFVLDSEMKSRPSSKNRVKYLGGDGC